MQAGLGGPTGVPHMQMDGHCWLSGTGTAVGRHWPYPNGTSCVALNAVTGEVLTSYNANHGGAGQQLADLKYPLHIGTALGLPGRVIILVTGLVPTVLFVTGVYTWWRKRQKRSARLGTLSSPSSHSSPCSGEFLHG